jgi:CheY-like chemotaxis protein
LAEEILIVEDDSDFRDALAELLQLKGYQVTALGNGQQALQKLQAGLIPCLILLDLMMPVMNGWDFRRLLLAHPQWSAIPVVLLSGMADLARHATNLRVAGCIAKPVDFDLLYRAVEQHC